MNRTAVFVTFAFLACVGLVGAIILSIHRPDALGGFVVLVGSLLGSVATFAGTAYGLGRLNEKVDAVKHQTNGTLSARDERIAVLEAEKTALLQQLAHRNKPWWRRLRT
ncbi:hypothetical protein [Rathayibacter sp. AY1A7]|uniref:hypothetical protein n=1 Tax=Rathayibacter sp. AY1A7 TaxID=2080524 RepID=UPI000CE885FD|nr:hypothetical protein [Rathayibacter sp. AY1A7]PPF21037.1 hypothetical protein C5B95_06400 [Rathayibacter sp. AY1A7]